MYKRKRKGILYNKELKIPIDAGKGGEQGLFCCLCVGWVGGTMDDECIL